MPGTSLRGVTLTTPDSPGARAVTVWDLEMLRPPTGGPGPSPDPDLRLERHQEPAPERSREFYRLVGADWYWVDRLEWDDQRWRDWVDRPEHHLWTCWRGDAPVGYFELEQQPAGAVELVYFGLVPAYQGRGVGRWLLERAIVEAWALPGVTRLWLHTCSLDGPNARANYEARGFRLRRTSVEYRLIS